MFKRSFHLTASRLRKHIGGKIFWWKNEECLTQLEKHGLPREKLIERQDSLSEDFTYLKNGAEILEETGIAVTVDNLVRFKDLYISDLSGLLELGVIESSVTTTRYLNYLEPFPFEPEIRMPSFAGIEKVYTPIQQYHRRALHVKQTQADWPGSLPEETERTILTEQRRVLRQYLVWSLESDLYTIDKHMFNYSRITGLRSLRTIRRTLNILTDKLEIPKQKILRNFFLLSIVPERLTDVIDNVDTIGSISLKQAVCIAPKLLAKTSQHILQVEQLLKDEGVEEDCSGFRVLVHTYQPATLRARLRMLRQSEMAPLLQHPRACQLLYYFNKAWRRMQEIRMRGHKCISLNILTANENIYQRFLNDGVDRTYVVNDTNHFLAQRLECTVEEVAVRMNKHPYRFYISVADVRDTLQLLQHLQYPNNVILDAVQILLYSRVNVEEAIKWVETSAEVARAGLLTSTDRTPSRFPSASQIADKRLLLALYYLERPYHFTGEGAMRIPSKVIR